MRKLLFIGAVVAPALFAAGGASACCDCDGASYGYTYGYAAPRVYGYSSYYRSGVRFYGARTYGWRGGVGVRRVGWGGRGRW